MIFFPEKSKNTKPCIWLVAIFISVLLLSFVIYNVDVNSLYFVFDSITWSIFIISLLVLLLEGLFTAIRFKLFTPGNPALKSCLHITSIFIVSLIILPARLGEIAVIFLLKKELKQKTGAAIMSVLTQRFIDLLFLCALLFIFTLMTSIAEQSLYLYVAIFLIISILISSIYKLDILLGVFASFFYFNKKLVKYRLFKNVYRMILQGRIWYRFHMNNKVVFQAIIISTLKWTSNIGGLTLLFYSINTPLNEVELILTSTAYNLLAIIPLQTIGGFGISEAGLMGILMFFNLPIDLSASISIISRIVLISTPFIFFTLVFSYLFITRHEKCSR